MKVTHRELDLENGVIRFVIEVRLDEAHLLINKEKETRIWGQTWSDDE